MAQFLQEKQVLLSSSLSGIILLVNRLTLTPPDAYRCSRAGPAISSLSRKLFVLEKTDYGPNKFNLGAENSLVWYNPCRGCGVKMRNVCSLL